MWLSGWSKRIKVIINHNDIDSDIIDLPILCYLSVSSGYNNKDISFIFDELQNDANRKKIAVTTYNGTTQCYVEIERWNSSSEQAWLWIKVPSTSSSIDTVLYLYYDANHVDNTTYVGDSGSKTEVWDNNFKGVWHLSENPAVSSIIDSTSNSNDGTPSNMDASNQISGQIDGALNFIASNEVVNCATSSTLQPADGITFEVWAKSSDAVEDQWSAIGGIASDVDWTDGYGMYFDSNTEIRFYVSHFTNSGLSATTDPDIWNHYIGTYDRFAGGTDELKLYVNGNLGATADYSSIINYNGGNFTIGELGGWVTDWLNGTIDVMRISSIARNAAWAKASHETQIDNLLDFGPEEAAENLFICPNF